VETPLDIAAEDRKYGAFVIEAGAARVAAASTEVEVAHLSTDLPLQLQRPEPLKLCVSHGSVGGVAAAKRW